MEKNINEINEPMVAFDGLGIDEKLNCIYSKLVDLETRCNHE